MFPQLLNRMTATGNSVAVAASALLQADPLDVLLAVDETWTRTNVSGVPAPPALTPAAGAPGTPARTLRHAEGFFSRWAPTAQVVGRPWDHLIYAYMIENTRALQIFGRLVREFRSGEALGAASPMTQRWLDITEALLFEAPQPFPMTIATSRLRPDPEAVRRNAYARLFNLELSFGTDSNGPASYTKPLAVNSPLIALLEEFLYEIWRAITNVKNQSGMNETDDDRIFQIAQELAFMLNERTQNATLAREELAAVTAASWIELVLDSNNAIITDLRAEGASRDGRLKIIGERVRLAPHSRSDALFGLAAPLSRLLRAVQLDVATTSTAWAFYLDAAPAGQIAPFSPLGAECKRIITEWTAATGRDLKARKLAVAVSSARQLR